MIINSSIKNYSVKFDLNDLNVSQTDIIIYDNKIGNDIEILKTDSLYALGLDISEKTKEYHKVGEVISILLRLGMKRNHRLIAIGGGVVQDIVGFISSILYRGIDWVFIPTTLLAQGDSCIGGKTSINFGNYKNQIGTFNPPSTIYIHQKFLNTLDDEQIKSGIGEMAHYFYIDGKDSFEYFRAYNNIDHYTELIKPSLDIKRRMIEIDEFDKGSRLIFNYGHSFGHAIESVTDYKIPHGIAVSLGMDMANFVSNRLDLLSHDDYIDMGEPLVWLYENIDFSILNSDKIIEKLMLDKKNKDGKLGLILTKGLGKMELVYVNPETIKKYLIDYFDEQFKDI